jgi:hypothetical protein
LHSITIPTPGKIITTASFGTTLRYGSSLDALFIDSSRKADHDALGFLPYCVYEGVLAEKESFSRHKYRSSEILITEDNADRTGWILTNYGSRDWAKIVQIWTRPDARRFNRAWIMVQQVERKAIALGKKGVTCRVAFDLESNAFWKTIGYHPINLVASTFLNRSPSKNQRPIWIYERRFWRVGEPGVERIPLLLHTISDMT